MRTLSLFRGCLAIVGGATGLAAQVVWLRKFSQVFGSTVQAASIVVATALAGLALGAYFVGRRGDHTSNPLRFAACLIALSGLSVGMGVPVFAAADVVMPRWLALGSAAQLALAALIVLPPTLLLGGVLPALIRVETPTTKALRKQFGMVYGWETAGGAAGGLLTGFYFIRLIGLHGTLLLLGVVGAAVGATVVLLARGNSKERPARRSSGELANMSMSRSEGLCLVAVFFSGFASLGMEIIWTRLLILTLGGDSFAYTTVVTSYLVGLSLGAFLSRWIVSGTSAPPRVFAWLQIGVAASSLGLLMVFWLLAAGPGQRWLAWFGEGWGMVIGGRFGLCLTLLLIPTVLVGMSVPTMAAYVLNGLGDASRRAGRLYAANTIGNVTGALATGFVLLPALGIQLSLVVLVSVSLMAAAVALLPYRSARVALSETTLGAWSRRAQMALIVLGFVLCLGWRWLGPIGPFGINEQWQDYRVTYYREGPVATVIVLVNRDYPDERLMAVDGVIIGESEGGVDEKQRMLAHLPYLLRPRATKKKILTIGLGTGILAGELIGQPGVEEVTCVELSHAVIGGAEQFKDLNGNVQQHPRVSIVAADGIHYLRQHDIEYNAIVSDAKSRPGHLGNVSFFSADYYQLCQSRLAPDGLFVQWVSLETPNRALQIILRTFVESFPHAAIGLAAPDSLYLVGAVEPLRLDVAEIQRHLESPRAAGLCKYDWRHACDIFGLMVADGALVEKGLSAIPVNTLDRPYLEFEAGELFRFTSDARKQENLRFLLSILKRTGDVPPIASDDAELASKCRQSSQLMLEAIIVAKAQQEGWLELATAKYQQALRLAEQHHRLRVIAADLHLATAQAYDPQHDSAGAISQYEQAVSVQLDQPEAQESLARLAREAGDLPKAARHYYKALQLDPDELELRLEFATTLAMMNKPKQAEDQLRQAIAQHPNEPRAHLALGIVLMSQAQHAEARQHFRRAIELDGTLEDAINQLGIKDL